MIIINKNIKLGFSVFIKTVLLTLMVWIIHISVVAIVIGWVNPQIEGYNVYYTEDGGQTTQEIYETFNIDDKKIEEYKNKDNYLVVAKPGKLSSNISNAINIAVTVCSLLLATAMYFTEFWNMGDIDANNFELRGVKYNKKRPLVIALLGYSPFILSYILLVVFKALNVLPSYSRLFYYINYYAYYIISLITPNLNGAYDLLINTILVCVILIPIPTICYGAYILGTKHIDIKRKIIYKKENNNG